MRRTFVNCEDIIWKSVVVPSRIILNFMSTTEFFPDLFLNDIKLKTNDICLSYYFSLEIKETTLFVFLFDYYKYECTFIMAVSES